MAQRDNSRKPFTPDRRCHWFDNNGRPYHRLDGGLGCPRGPKCFFAHPTDLDLWRTARPGGEPPLRYLTEDECRAITSRHRSPPRSFHPSQARPRSLSPGRRRTPPRRLSREREQPSLVSRIRGRRSLSRERELREPRESRQFIPRNSRSRSPGRARLHRTPPPQHSTPRGPRMSIGPPAPEGPRGTYATARTPATYPKVETDINMRDAPGPAYRREDSVASSHHTSHHQTPARPVPTIATSSAAPVTTPRSQVSSTNNSAPATSQSSAAVARPAQPDTIKDMLESSTLKWQEISSQVATASSVTAAKPRTTSPNGATGDLPVEDRAKIWSSRIELLASGLRIYDECRSMENDVRDYQQLVESFSYQSLPPEDRSVIDGHLQGLQTQLAGKTEEMKKVLEQLADTKLWPTNAEKAKSLPQDISQEVAKQVQGLKVSASHLQGLFQTLGSRWEQVSKSLQSNRLSAAGAGQSQPQPNTLIAEALVPKELEKVRNSIASFEERLRTLENVVVNNGEVVLEQVDAIVTESAQALTLAATGTVQATPPVPRAASALTAHQLKMLETLQQNAAVTAGQVQQLSQKVTEMAAANEQLQVENMHLQQENAHLKQQLEESMVVQLPASSDAKLDQMQAEMRALNAAVVAALAQRPYSQPPAPSAEALTQHIVPQVVASLPQAITPELRGFRDQVQELLRAQQAELVKELSSNMSTTLQSVDAIRVLMNKLQSSPAGGALPNGGGVVKGEASPET
ncbi:hypothetical protein BD413DRAFT_172001 [Trametes elegans]|nr:hypothetical protein BD413DRAFT_172001 [Trametes elegans]